VLPIIIFLEAVHEKQIQQKENIKKFACVASSNITAVFIYFKLHT